MRLTDSMEFELCRFRLEVSKEVLDRRRSQVIIGRLIRVVVRSTIGKMEGKEGGNLGKVEVQTSYKDLM